MNVNRILHIREENTIKTLQDFLMVAAGCVRCNACACGVA